MKKSYFKWGALSSRQKKVLCWWHKDSPYASYNGIIADGAIRSGKTVSMWYILTEIGSIIENAMEMGAKVPAWLPKILNATLHKIDSVGEAAIDDPMEKAVSEKNVNDSGYEKMIE